MNKIKKWIFILSITLNVIFALGLLFKKLNSPSYKLGILTQDINVGFFMSDSTIFKIPKGITVKDVSPRGIAAIGQFENNRFEIILTTGTDGRVVDYNIPKDSMACFGNYYSIDYPIYKLRK